MYREAESGLVVLVGRNGGDYIPWSDGLTRLDADAREDAVLNCPVRVLVVLKDYLAAIDVDRGDRGLENGSDKHFAGGKNVYPAIGLANGAFSWPDLNEWGGVFSEEELVFFGDYRRSLAEVKGE